MQDLNDLDLDALWIELDAASTLDRLIASARDEDLRNGVDVTSESIIAPDRRGRAVLRAREAGVVVGERIAPAVVRGFGAEVRVQIAKKDGESINAGESLLSLDGPLRDILLIERTLLNLINRLTGIATLTSRFVQEVRGARALICDTRKTTPGWRAIEKFAVRCGGGTLHRIGLFDAALYKDNHLAHLALHEFGRAVREAAERARDHHALRFVEVEVDSLEQFDQLLTHATDSIDIILLDNFTLDDLREAVARRNADAPRMILEASGGVRLETVRAIAATGVDRISVGALTHGVRSFDFGLDIESAGSAP